MERRLAVHAGADAPALSRARGSRARIAALAAAVLAVATGTAEARPKRRDARVAFDRGIAAYQQRSYEAAAEALGKSFELERDVDTLFAWAQAERKLEHCDKAIDLYEKLLSFNLPAANKTAVEQKLAECRAIVPPPAPPPIPEPAPVAPASSDAPAAPPAAAGQGPAALTAGPSAPIDPAAGGRPWYGDPVALTLLGSGVAAGGVGAGLLISAQSASSQSKTATNYKDARDLRDAATLRGNVGLASAIAGGALVAGGLVWILTHRDHSEQRAITGWLAPDGGGLAISGPF